MLADVGPSSPDRFTNISFAPYRKIALGTRGQPSVGESTASENQSSVTTAEMGPGEAKGEKVSQVWGQQSKTPLFKTFTVLIFL